MTGKESIKDYRRNNLDKSSSPYLLQHTANPVWWQEWNDDLIRYALSTNKLLFVSVGYATCHWCHVMASEAFSDPGTASYLNDHFVCVKVDREQRPDIDQFLMDFINTQNGRGGWPLNVFLTPELRPLYALTYAPVNNRDSMYSLRVVCEKVIEFFEHNRESIPSFVSGEHRPEISEESELTKTLSKYYDPEDGGFGSGQKFPPHSSLLYLLYQAVPEDSPSIKTICIKTLDTMLLRGLNDHLQGGIFRYCVDREWTIPHFEKMLYDQAMALWCYSLAYKVIGKESYRIMAEKILCCIEECFNESGLYITGHDADTEHEEGATYVWSYEQLKSELTADEFVRFTKVYFIEKNGNFEGMNHLLRRNNELVNDIEARLLSIRKMRKQPSRDDKILCGINALLVIAKLQAGRFLNRPELEIEAAQTMRLLLKKFWDGHELKHSFYKGIFQKQNYLFDAASVLTALTMLFEIDDSWNGFMTEMALYVDSFREGEKWRESWADDFLTVYASWLDHPVPSSVSLAEMGLTRVHLMAGHAIPSKQYREPFKSDFYNISVMVNNGLFHLFESEKPIPWNLLPANSIKIKGNHNTECYLGACSPLEKRYFNDEL